MQSMSPVLAYTVQLIIHFRYAVLFPAVVLEGPIATVIAGLLISHGQLQFGISYLVVVVADTMADIGYYLLGLFGQARLAERFKARLGITTEHLTALEQSFQNNGIKPFLASKLIHGPGVAVLVAAGVARMPLLRFLMYNIPVTLVKSLLLLFVGYYFGQALNVFKKWFDISALIATGIVLIILGALVVHRWRQMQKP